MTSGTIVVLNGPNLNLLGRREPHIYGHETLADVEALCRRTALDLGHTLEFRQTNAEHQMIDWIHEVRETAGGIAINPAGFTSTSISVLDALLTCKCPIVEVHITNIHRRETFRQHSYVSLAATGVICGCGTHGYVLAVQHLARLIGKKEKST